MQELGFGFKSLEFLELGMTAYNPSKGLMTWVRGICGWCGNQFQSQDWVRGQGQQVGFSSFRGFQCLYGGVRCKIGILEGILAGAKSTNTDWLPTIRSSCQSKFIGTKKYLKILKSKKIIYFATLETWAWTPMPLTSSAMPCTSSAWGLKRFTFALR